MGWLIGTTGRSFLDTSFVIHWCFWVFFASNFAYMKKPVWLAMVVMVVLAYGWEIFERYAERAWPHIWLHPESWHNAYVSDILAGVLGVLVAYWLVRSQ